MKMILALLILGAGVLAGSAHAQKFVAYVPTERDFRVLFPAPPVRSTTSDGSIAFKSRFEADDSSVEYAVYRLPSSVTTVIDAEHTLRQRLLARLGEDTSIQTIRDDTDSMTRDGHVFTYRRNTSIHRLVGGPGRYYELEVAMGSSRYHGARTARDFFSSFQGTGLSLPSLGITIGQTVEAWCKDRTDVFSRAFCEYSVCLQPGYEMYPHCTNLFRR